ncbi:MAG: helicase [Deltaproteobacteria bacterium]|nr:helicase [Deltaproteobacteria bacterium]
MSLDALARALRRAAPGPAWKLGQRAAEAGRVALASRDPDLDQVVLAVTGAHGHVHEVFLWPGDVEWECDCEVPAEACLHAVAALTAVERGLDSLVQADSPAQLVACLTTQEDRVDLTFAVRTADALEPCDGEPPTALVDDDALSNLLRQRRLWTGQRIPGRGYGSLIKALLHVDEVLLNGDPVSVSAVPLDPVVIVDRVGRGYRVRLAPGTGGEVLYPGDPNLILGDNTLRPQGTGRLTQVQRHQLRTPQVFGEDELPRLTAEWLPQLEKAVQVVRLDGVPSSQSGDVSHRIELRQVAGVLEVRARIVYGDPPAAEIRNGQLVPLGGVTVLPPRDRDREIALEAEMVSQVGLRAGQRMQLQGVDAARFVRDRLERFDGEVQGDRVAQLYGVQSQALTAQVRWGAGGLDLAFSGGAASVDAERVLAAWRRGDDLVGLPDGGFAPLPRAWLETHGEQVALLLEGTGAGETTGHKAPVVASLLEATGGEVPDALQAVVDGLRREGGLALKQDPSGFQGTLRGYQQEGWSWLAFLADQGLGGVLADDMGLGKTVQTLCALLAEQGKGPALVVAPTSVLRNWHREAERFTPSLNTAVLHGPRRGKILAALQEGSLDLVVTSYAVLRRDVDELVKVSFRAVVLDEAQAIKNPASQTARAARRLVAHHRLALSGTPIENRLSELWSLMEFLNPGFFGPQAQFHDRLGGPAMAGDERAIATLRARIAPFVLRRRKQDVATDLPERSEDVLFCPLSEDQESAYQAVRIAAQQGLKKSEPGGRADSGRRMAVLAALTRLRQASCHPALVPGGADAGESGKVDRLLQALESLCASGHRALVFSQWTSLLDLIEPRLRAAELDFLRLDGSTRDRHALVDRFQRDDGPPVFLISLKAGGTGLNLSAADHVFLMDPWWNPAVEQQAIDRAHRIGQDKPVFAWKLVSENTVEERVLALQERKSAMASAVLDGAQGLSGLSIEDLEALLES